MPNPTVALGATVGFVRGYMIVIDYFVERVSATDVSSSASAPSASYGVACAHNFDLILHMGNAGEVVKKCFGAAFGGPRVYRTGQRYLPFAHCNFYFRSVKVIVVGERMMHVV